jgi:uncharacterized protein YabE (DUF348 family)
MGVVNNPDQKSMGVVNNPDQKSMGVVNNPDQKSMGVVNNQTLTLYTHQTTVRGVLNEAGITLRPEDLIEPAFDANLPDDATITIQVAIPVVLQVDGDTFVRLTQEHTLGNILQENNIQLKRGDRVWLNDALVTPNASLPTSAYSLALARSTSSAADPATPRIRVQRAIPLLLNDSGLTSTLYSIAPTIGEALRQAGVLVYLGDEITPDLGTPLTPGYQVYIRRSRPASISVDGRLIQTRTRADNVAGLLAQAGVELISKDYTLPGATSPVQDGMNVQVVRVRETLITQTESIAFETKWLPNPALEIDQREVAQQGEAGAKNRLIRITSENGKETSRSIDREWIAREPTTKIINYGTKIVERSLTLPDGSTAKYWRKIRVLATSYTAATSGKARSNPLYGKTYLGMQATLGIVAVDPSVINLRSQIYVPGYGVALAADTGGRIKGRRVDLAYDEHNLVLWYRWVDVYVLSPVPPFNQIRWVLPDYPTERRIRD